MLQEDVDTLNDIRDINKFGIGSGITEFNGIKPSWTFEGNGTSSESDSSDDQMNSTSSSDDQMNSTSSSDDLSDNYDTIQNGTGFSNTMNDLNNRFASFTADELSDFT